MSDYLMESDDEGERLERKTDVAALRRQLTWAGLRPGMRVLDAGCGPGLTSAVAYELVQPGGSVVGVDASAERIASARRRHGRPGLDFEVRDLTRPLEAIGDFDLVWSRFVLEYHRDDATRMVAAWARSLRPGGWMCLADLDGNAQCLHGMSPALASVHAAIQHLLAARMNFDADIGRKLYATLYDLGFEDLDVHVEPHHLLYGAIRPADLFNWRLKAEVVTARAPALVADYPGGREGFLADWVAFLEDPRRFIFTPLMLCRGRRPTPPT